MNYRERLKRSDPVFFDMLNRKTKRLLKVLTITGGSAGAHAVTGILKGDELVSVLHFTPGGSATLATLTSEFIACTDDGIVRLDGYIDNTGGTDTSGDTLVVTWIPWENR